MSVSATGPVLAGIRVLEFSAGWTAAAWAGRLLAELGAEVIKVEPAAGDPLRHGPGGARFGVIHPGKRIRRLPAGDALPEWLTEAIDRADVAIDGLPARARPVWRPAVDRAALARPDLILCRTSVYGRTGPLAEAPANELIAQARAGVIDSTGYPDAAPARAGVAVGEHAGGLFATLGLRAALYARETTGRGDVIDLATHDCLIAYLGTFLPAYFQAGERPDRIGNRHPALAPWNVYPVRDGWLIICSGSDAQWRQIAATIDRPELADDPRLAESAIRAGNADLADAAIAAWTSQRDLAEVQAAFDAINVPNGPILTVGDLLADPHFRAREMVRELPDGTPAVGRIFKLGDLEPPDLPARFDPEPATTPVAWPARPARPIPATDPGDRPPLAGLRLLELASYTAGPYCGRLLAALGAEVIKVEPPQGEALRRFGYRVEGDGYLFHINSADKSSVVIDTRTPGGRAALLALARPADAIYENFAPGTLAAQGLGPADLRAANPGIIWASINGFGLTGPLRDRRAYDTVIQGLAGLLHLTGGTDRPPVKIGVSIADVIGATGAAVALLAALYHRRRTGWAGLVDVSMHDLAGWLTAEYWPIAAQPAGRAIRPGNGHPYLAPHGVYPARGGRVAIAVETEAEWRALRRAVPGLVNDPAGDRVEERLARAPAIDAALAAWTADRSVAEIVGTLTAAGVPAAPVLNPADAVEHDQTAVRQAIVTASQPSGLALRQINIPLRFAQARVATRAGGPALGNATDRVLGGLPAGEIAISLDAARGR